MLPGSDSSLRGRPEGDRRTLAAAKPLSNNEERTGTSTPGPGQPGNPNPGSSSLWCAFLPVDGLRRAPTCLADQTAKCCGKPKAERNKTLLVEEVWHRDPHLSPGERGVALPEGRGLVRGAGFCSRGGARRAGGTRWL